MVETTAGSAPGLDALSRAGGTAPGRERGAPARHDLLAVAPADWPAVAATRAEPPRLAPEAAALVEGWGAAGRPVVARRPGPGERPGTVPVGLPLPPHLGKARVALAIPGAVPWRPARGVALAEAAARAPEAWRGTVDAVLSLGSALGLVPGVFGALLWQSLTGLPYLHPRSDLDLLWPVSDPAAVPPLLDGLARIDAAAPVRIDGEVLTPRGGVSWRELAAARGGAVLVKSVAGIGLVAASDLFAPEAPRCP